MNTEIKYLELLSKTFKNIAETSTEIINLQAIMNLPKGTEHFMTDIHGEYEAFNHVLRNGSGTIRNKIEEAYGNTLTENDKKELGKLIKNLVRIMGQDELISRTMGEHKTIEFIPQTVFVAKNN